MPFDKAAVAAGIQSRIKDFSTADGVNDERLDQTKLIFSGMMVKLQNEGYFNISSVVDETELSTKLKETILSVAKDVFPEKSDKQLRGFLEQNNNLLKIILTTFNDVMVTAQNIATMRYGSMADDPTVVAAAAEAAAASPLADPIYAVIQVITPPSSPLPSPRESASSTAASAAADDNLSLNKDVASGLEQSSSARSLAAVHKAQQADAAERAQDLANSQGRGITGSSNDSVEYDGEDRTLGVSK